MDDSQKQKKQSVNAELANVKLLFIAVAEKPLVPAFNFLKKRGWTPFFASSMKDAVEVITTEQPNYVLISWNLPSTNISRIEKTIVATFRLPCIIFTEKVLDGKQQNALTTSGVKHYILAPLSGPSVHMKVRKLILEGQVVAKGPESEKRKSRAIKSFKEEKIEIRSRLEDIPKDGEWEQAGTSEDGEPIWMLRSKKKSVKNEKKRGTYVFKGKQPPMLDAGGEWKLPAEGGTLGYSHETLEDTSSDMDSSEEMHRTSSHSIDDEGETVALSTSLSEEGDENTQIKNSASMRRSSKDRKALKNIPDHQNESLHGLNESDQDEIAKSRRKSRVEHKKEETDDAEQGPKRSEKNGTGKEDEVALEGLVAKVQETEKKNLERQLQREKEAEEKAQRREAAQIEKQVRIAQKKKEQEERKKAKKLESEKAKEEADQRQRESAQKALDRELAKAEKEKEQKKAEEKRSHLKSSEKDDLLKTSRIGKALPDGLKEEQEPSPEEAKPEAKADANKSRIQGRNEAPQRGRLEKGEAIPEAERFSKQHNATSSKPEKQTGKPKSPTAEEFEEGKSVSHQGERGAEEKEKEKLNIDQKPEKPSRELTPATKVEKKKYDREKDEASNEVKPVEVQAQGVEVQSTADLKHGVVAAVQDDISKEMRFRNKTKILGKRTDTLLAQCVVKALEQTVVSNGQEQAIPLLKTTFLDCIPINSSRFKGLLIYATSGTSHVGADFTRTMKNFLLTLMNEQGEEMRDEGELELEVMTFSFIDVATEYGEFVTLSQHLGHELGMAFVQSEGVFPTLKAANQENMIPIDIETVQPEEKVGFDAYIHMEKNSKYLKYVRRGGRMEQRQKQNLAEHQIRHFFIKGNDVKLFYGHCATAFVERMVRQFLAAIKRSA